MKNFLNITLLLLIITIGACSDSKYKVLCQRSGHVIGYDFKECSCCPGWLVELGTDTLKFLTVPDEEELWDVVRSYGYPIPIIFEYKDDNSSCSDFYKVMTCMELDVNTDCSKEGVIYDYNSAECVCCPGWLIASGTDSIKILPLPIETEVRALVESKGFPIHVKLEYEDATDYCAGMYKKVTCMQLVD